jgi:hypothetical protein
MGKEEGGETETYWMLYWPDSILAWVSEFRVSFRVTCFICDFTSCSAASDSASSTDAHSMRPVWIQELADTSRQQSRYA